MSDVQTSLPATERVLSAVTAQIDEAQKNAKIEAAVVDVFASREIKRRTDLLVQGFDALSKLTTSYDQVNKPDTKFTDSEGKQVELTSAKRTQEQQAAKKKVDKLVTALTGALEKADFAALEKALKGGDKNGAADED